MAPDSNLTLGEFLRQERERRGITIEQVASATKIGIKLLHALEADQYTELPAKPFIRGFVTSYARFVGLDTRETLTRFGEFVDKRALDRPPRDSGHSGYAFEKKEGDQSRTLLTFVMVGFLVIGGALFVFLKPNLHHKSENHLDRLRAVHASSLPVPAAAVSGLPPAPESEKAEVKASPAPQPSIPAVLLVSKEVPPKESPKESKETAESPRISPPEISARPPGWPGQSTVPSPSPSPVVKASAKDPLSSGSDLKASETRHKVVIKALDSVYVRYQVDSRPTNQFILRKDRILVLRAQDLIKFQTSNPQSVTYNYNSQGATPLEASKNAVTRQNDATLFFPAEIAETIQEPFPGTKPLMNRKVPGPPPPSPLPSPNP